MFPMTFKYTSALFLGFVLIMSSCVDLGFPGPQPENGKVLKELPEKLLGAYANNQDTLIISARMVISGSDTTILAFDSYMELREWKNFYFLNSHKASMDYWTSIIVEYDEEKITIYLPEIQEEDKLKLEKKYNVREVQNEQGDIAAFVIDPSTREWKKLLKGPFYSKSKFKKIN